MKERFYFFVVIILLIAGCRKTAPIDDDDEVEITGGLWLKMGDNSIVSTSDINFYDVSTHMIYLKNKLPYLGLPYFNDFGYIDRKISVHVGEDEIYECQFYVPVSSSEQFGVRYSSFNHDDDIICISFSQYSDAITDPRNDKRIIAALKKYKQYHEGLRCELKSYKYSNGKLVFNIVLYNPDTFNYYYLDPDKMGIGLFHYFTNGPIFRDFKNLKWYTHQETVIHPEPWDSWKYEWLSLIKSGQRKNISITYNRFDIIPPGKYSMYFEFPGLCYGISQKDLTLKDERIWMGWTCIEKEVSIP